MRGVALFVLLTCSLSLRAQSPLGTVTGLASDPSGAAIPQAKVTVTNKQTGVASVTATNAAGAYTLPNLPPGSYQLTAEAKGFRPLETAAFPIDAFRTVRQDLKFEVATASTEVTVSATASTVIQTESPAITAALSTKQILDLPTNLRSVFGNAGDSGLLFVMAPLTIPGLVQVGSGATWTIPGGSGNALNAKVDGILTTFANFGSPDPVSQPSMEAVQEFTANVLTNRAEFGGMGTITSVTRTGTNQYHGGVFWYVRNSAFDARNTFSSTKPGQNIHNYGATFGGPFKKDKTFFQLTFDGTQGSRAYLFTSNVPTLAQRRGDFTGAAALRNPLNGQDPFIGNTIRPEFLSPQALKMQNRYFPLPNYGDPSLTAGNYRAAFNGPETHGIGEVRVDHNLSSGHSLFGRYQSKIDDYEIPGVRSELPPSTAGTSTNIRTVNFFTVGDSYAVRPNLFNEFRAGFVMLSSKSDSDVKGQALLDEFGIQGLPPRVGINGVPNVAITGYSSVTQRLLNPVNDGHWQASDNVSWIRGKHSIKFGGEVVHWLLNRYMPVEAAVFGSFSVTNRYTGDAYADFLMGLPTSVTRVDPYPAQYTRWNDISFYVQDDFKVTSRLSLSYGLRYEFNGPPSVRDNNLYSFDEASGSIVVPDIESLRLFSPAFPSNLPVITAQQAGLNRTLRKADLNNFAPRFGFSYQPGKSGKMVIRGGWGVYYSHYSGATTGALASGPYSLSSVSTNNIVNGKPIYTLQDPFTTPGASGTLALTAMNPNFRNGYSQQYSISFERELTSTIGVRASYIGSRGSQLPYTRNLNQPLPSTTPFAQSRRPYPLFSNIAYSENGANSMYSGLQAQVQKRFSKGLFFSSAWTWAKNLSEVDDTANLDFGTQIENAYDRRRDRGNVYAVPRHLWMNQALYALPFKGMLFGGWQMNALVNVSTGHWLTAQFSGSDPSNSNVVGGRPDALSAVTYLKSVEAWFERSTFSIPPANSARFGTAARNSVEGPGYVIANFGVSKSMKFERIGSIQIAASFQNVLNHVNLGQPNMTVNTVQGGTITSTHVFSQAGASRNGLLSLRWNF